MSARREEGPGDRGDPALRRAIAERREEERRAARLAREEALRERRLALRQRLEREVLWAGEGVSSGLSGEPDPARLAARGLPILRDAADLAALLGIDLRALRWLTLHREVAPVVHYRQFQLPKRRGGTRTISAPRPRLRAAQEALRRELLARLSPTPEAMAFVPGRSVLTNACAHLAPAVLVKLDLRDFFGTITFPRVRGLFRALGYGGMVATLLALLVTEAPRGEVEIDGRTWYAALGPRSLPQGAPTSPELTNQLARRLDRRLVGFARRHGWSYTRYADDLCFSRGDEPEGAVRRLLGTVRAVLEGEGFQLNPDKLVVARRGRQQRVTGVVVNERPAVPRALRRRLRAAAHRVAHDGFADREERERLLGQVAWVRMVQPEAGERLLQALRGGREGGA